MFNFNFIMNTIPYFYSLIFYASLQSKRMVFGHVEYVRLEGLEDFVNQQETLLGLIKSLKS